jgi:hypothetical protein
MPYTKENAMNPLLILMLVGGLILGAMLFRPAAPPQVVYVPVEVAAPARGLGCLPLVLAAVAVLVLLWMLG